MVYSSIVGGLLSLAVIATWGKIGVLRARLSRVWIAIKRSSVCNFALFLALLSPSLGILVVCTYFLLYDRVGRAAIPASLQQQCRAFFKVTQRE
jgi:hypothetical protein